MNNSPGKTQGVVSAEQPIEGLGPQGVGEIEEAAGVYVETKIEELAEGKLRFDKPELAQQWDKIQPREREASIPKIEQSRSLEENLVQSLILSRPPENE
jgi:hypothetical protein